MKITKKWLEKENACEKSIEWFDKNKCEGKDCFAIIEKLGENGENFDWQNWLILKLLGKKARLKYATKGLRDAEAAARYINDPAPLSVHIALRNEASSKKEKMLNYGRALLKKEKRCIT